MWPLPPGRLADMAPDFYAEVAGESGRVGPLDEVRMAASSVTAAKYSLRKMVRAAHDAGEDVSEIAKAAGVARPKVYEMLRGTSEEGMKVPPRSQWPRVLDEAMMDLLEHVGPSTTEQLMAGIASGDLAVKGRRVALGLKNRRGKPEAGSLEWERYTLAALVMDDLRKQGLL